jgi:hypothetical protein
VLPTRYAWSPGYVDASHRRDLEAVRAPRIQKPSSVRQNASLAIGRPSSCGRVAEPASEQPAMSEPNGYLVVETHPDHADLVRVYGTRELPILPDGSPTDPGRPRIRYVASFSALQVAQMHAQTALRKGMVDAEAGLYRVDPLTAVAAVDAIDLSHRTIHLDPRIAADPRLSAEIEQRRRRQRMAGRIWTSVGILAIIILILLSQIPVF